LVELTATLKADTTLTPLQSASVQLIPSASSMAFSIAELIKGGFLVPAMVLFRPLVERVATLAYLEAHQEAITLWRAGWPHHQRPSLRHRLACLVPGATPAIVDNFVEAITRYNSLVHGDPIAGEQSLSQLIGDDGSPWAIERDLMSPQRARAIAAESDIAVVFLVVMIERIFPSPTGRKGPTA
jgi:hypothetical protein